MCRLAPELRLDEARSLVASLSPVDHPPGDRQQTDELIARAIDEVRPATVPAAAVVRAAMCLPARGRIEPFDGAADLLVGLAAARVRVVIVSNTLWRDAAAYRQDFADLGVAELVDGVVTSVDIGWRKPHPIFFAQAVARAGHAPGCCVMVGDSEVNDIAPARALGMVTVRVAIEEPAPRATAADHVCRSLPEVVRVLCGGAAG